MGGGGGGGWIAPVLAVAATAAAAYFTGGTSLLAEGAIEGGAAAAEGGGLLAGEAAGEGLAVGEGAAAAGEGAAAAGEAGTVAGEVGTEGAMAAGEATGGVAVDAAGLPLEAASAGGGGLFDGLTASQGVMAGLAASSLLGSMQKQPQIPTPTPVTAPPAMQSASSPTSLLSQLNGVGQGGGQKGVAQTLLSGTNGVDPTTLALGKNTLLGQ